jgi:hypothetical protein
VCGLRSGAGGEGRRRCRAARAPLHTAGAPFLARSLHRGRCNPWALHLLWRACARACAGALPRHCALLHAARGRTAQHARSVAVHTRLPRDAVSADAVNERSEARAPAAAARLALALSPVAGRHHGGAYNAAALAQPQPRTNASSFAQTHTRADNARTHALPPSPLRQAFPALRRLQDIWNQARARHAHACAHVPARAPQALMTPTRLPLLHALRLVASRPCLA